MISQVVGGFLFAAVAFLVLIFYTFGPRTILRPLEVDGQRIGPLQRVIFAFKEFVRFLDTRAFKAASLRIFATALAQSGMAISLGTYLTYALALTILLFSVGLIVNGTVAGLILAIACVGVSFWLPRVLESRRIGKFENQFDFTLELLSSSIRAGHGLIRSIEVVAKESSSPTSEEFSRALNENRIGIDMTSALHSVARRMRSQEMEWVVQAIGVHLEAGGNLSSMFDDVLSTIRDRNQIRQQVKALSADGRISARVMSGIPLVLIVVIGVMNPTYFEPILSSEIAPLFFGGLAGLFVAGVIWVSRITKITF